MGIEYRNGVFVVTHTLLETATANADGLWYSLEGLFPVAVTVEGTLSAGAIDIRVSNRPNKPTDRDRPTLFSPGFATIGAKAVDLPFNWISAESNGSFVGDVQVYLVGRSR